LFAVTFKRIGRNQGASFKPKNIGRAISGKEHGEDIEIIKEMSANTLRLAHYQHAQYFYDAALTAAGLSQADSTIAGIKLMVIGFP